MSLIDSSERSQATDPRGSFIVQAPAGSGKTEILTQRYLRLLSTVTAPEQIIALTFTRKAASEMRERIILALQQAAANQPASSAHQKNTLDYAHQALQRSATFNWDLLHQPNRLKIITIDSLCQSINQSIPLLEKQIAYAQITEKPGSHYISAARACIKFALTHADYQPAIKTLLLHVDNKQAKLIRLFTTLLAQRDQWLRPLFQARMQEKASFEDALKLIEAHELARFTQSIPFLLADNLVRLARELAIIENNTQSPRYPLSFWFEFKQTNQELATALGRLLLTTEGAFRNAFDHHVGLKRGVCPNEDYDRIKSQSKELLEQLKGYPDFLESLIHISQLPDPHYDPEQWEVLQALFDLLPLLVGHLQLLFSEHNEIDFTAIAQQALAALGDADNPTDLALYLDNAIHHLLVDEFQDTSISQFELLNKLVHGWSDSDGKTLFIVGDPMQSIYRFRQAEVGLFFRAKEQGIGPVHLKSLELRCNFRSTETLVQWVNHHFAQVFPAQIDIESGAVSFYPSANVLSEGERSTVQALAYANREEEAQALIQLIRQELEANSHQTMAILVRSRSQLSVIIRLLRQHGIAYQGTDIDLLANLMHLRDAWSLTQALLLPGNRLSWLAVLRSPYCGLNLPDLHCIAQFNKNKSIYAALGQLDKIPNLSPEGLSRAQFFYKIMHQALAQRYQRHLSDWVVDTAKKLHHDSMLTQSQLADLNQLWALLDRHEHDGRILDMTSFQSELNSLYSQQATPARLQVMTIHKSKGLEFDTVFLPSLGSKPNRGDNPMLRWLKLPTEHDAPLFLVSPMQAAHQERCALYDYLGRIDDEKSSFEAQRVLYVAVTRAKSRLYLLDCTTKPAKNSFRSLLKHQEFSSPPDPDLGDEATDSAPQLMRLPAHYYQQDLIQTTSWLNPPLALLKPGITRLTGIVAHKLLHWICSNHPQNISDIPWDLALREYISLGMDCDMQTQALKVLKDQISLLFHDTIGAWIIAPHEHECNEFELLVEQQDRIITRILDRSFIENDILWIIDFKTGKENEATLIDHQKQLNEYAYHLSSRSPLPIHCGVYYLANGHWSTWVYEASLPSAPHKVSYPFCNQVSI